MGNCSGLFANCTGETDANSKAVRKIDTDKMKQALAANEADRAAGA